MGQSPGCQAPVVDRRQPIDPVARKIRVCEQRCSTCIFWKDERSAVSPDRARDVIQGNLDAETLLSCHSTLYQDDFIPAVCAGFWAKHRNDVLAGRLAQALIGIIRIKPPSLHKKERQ